jgi:hypothetical protein
MICRAQGMALRISYKPGAAHSMEAGKYFLDLAGDLVDDLLVDMRARNYLVQRERQAPLALRIWTLSEPSDEKVMDMLVALRTMGEDVDVLSGSTDLDHVKDIVQRWMFVGESMDNFFIEQLPPGSNFKSEGSPDMAVCVMGGHLRMLSSDHVLFVEQDTGLFGLTIAGQGSYLFEELAASSLPVQRGES